MRTNPVSEEQQDKERPWTEPWKVVSVKDPARVAENKAGGAGRVGRDRPSSSHLCDALNDLSKWNQTFPYFNIYSQRMKSKFLSTTARPTTFCSPPPFQRHLQAVPSTPGTPGTFTCLDNFFPMLPLPGRFSYLTWQIPTHQYPTQYVTSSEQSFLAVHFRQKYQVLLVFLQHFLYCYLIVLITV